MPTWLITGGAGFIGSCFVRQALARGESVVVLDALTYAGSRSNLPNNAESTHGLTFIHGDICDAPLVTQLLNDHAITHLVNFAAESHVDNSIAASAEFIRTNITGTHTLLTCFTDYWKKTTAHHPEALLRYVQISTDEVFGSLTDGAPAFTEETPFAPNSPYSASKAAADMLVRAWNETHDLPTITTHCSNNYGPRQHAEKLIPKMITNALSGQPLPVYGKGDNIRDWIHVEDHCHGIYLAATKGETGKRYCLGGRAERTNMTIVKHICAYLDSHHRAKDGRSYAELIEHVEDRLGHDWRYAINDDYAQQSLGFTRNHSFETALNETIEWYCNQHQVAQIA